MDNVIDVVVAPTKELMIKKLKDRGVLRQMKKLIKEAPERRKGGKRGDS